MNGGMHVLLDVEMPEGDWMTSSTFIEGVMRSAASLAGATILNSIWHHFGEGQGVTGVLILAESHISVHTFPEVGLACFDIFMCGKADPLVALTYMIKALPAKVFNEQKIERRGVPS